MLINNLPRKIMRGSFVHLTSAETNTSLHEYLLMLNMQMKTQTSTSFKQETIQNSENIMLILKTLKKIVSDLNIGTFVDRRT